MKACKKMSKSWKKQEKLEHGVKPGSKAWFKKEKKEGHKSLKGKKDWAKWKKEEAKEPTHKNKRR